MKRIVWIMLALSLLLTGCGGNGADEQSPPEEESSAAEVEESVPEEPQGPQELRLVVPEGYTMPRIGMLLEEMGVCTAEEFVAAAQEGDYTDFPLIAGQPENENRCFTLEGYLFPDTYYIYETDSPESIIRRMLANTESKIPEQLRLEIESFGLVLDEVITIASIIEKEALGGEHMGDISSVLHNRLAAGMQLQCDVTYVYVQNVIHPFIDGDIGRYDDYYDTYECAALPAGPICNPGIEAINAAIDPPDTDYLYFLTDNDQNFYFTADFDEHEENGRQAGVGVYSETGGDAEDM